MQEAKQAHQDQFLEHLVAKKAQAKEAKRKLVLKQMSIASNRSDGGFDEYETQPTVALDIMKNKAQAEGSDSEVSEGGQKIQKEIDKMTGFNLQVVSMPINLDKMRRLQLTPKDGIRMEDDTKAYLQQLRDKSP